MLSNVVFYVSIHLFVCVCVCVDIAILSSATDTKQLNEIYDTHHQLSYQDMINHDERRRFRISNHNQDNKMTKDEFGDFIHPEDVPHMKDIVIEVRMCVVWYSGV